jgi:hypothetical protein
MTQESEQLVVENALIHYEDGKHTCSTGNTYTKQNRRSSSDFEQS